MVMGIVWCVLDGLGDVVCTYSPLRTARAKARVSETGNCCFFSLSLSLLLRKKLLIKTSAVTALPFTMMSQIFLRRSQKIQLGCLFGLAGLNLATNILRTYYTVDRNLQRYAHLNAPWFILQGTLAVILCALPCYGSQITRKKPRTHDGIRVVDNSGTTHTGLYSMDSLGARVVTKKDVDSVISPPRAIKVRDDLKQNADSTFPDSGDRRVRHSVAIWSD